MPIIIPSKNIYQKDNPKVLSNYIDVANIDFNIVNPANQYDVSVFGKNYDIDDSQKQEVVMEDNSGLDPQQAIVGRLIYYCYAYAAYDNKKTYSVQVNIPLLKDNAYISNVKTGTYVDDMGETINNIKISIFGDIEKGSATTTFPPSDSSNDFTPNDFTLTANETQEGVLFDFPSPIESKFTYSVLTAKTTVSLKDAGNVDFTEASIKTIDGVEYYVIGLSVMCDLRVLTWGGGYVSNNLDSSQTGTYTKYTAKRIEINIYGNTIGIDIEQKSYPLSYDLENAQNPHSVQGSELMQNIKMGQYLSRDLLSSYINGKETATLLCSISDYYYPNYVKEYKIFASDGQDISSNDNVEYDSTTQTYIFTFPDGDNIISISDMSVYNPDMRETPTYRFSGNKIYITVSLSATFAQRVDIFGIEFTSRKSQQEKKAISISDGSLPMTFEIGDLVVPFVFGADGKDKPMSADKSTDSPTPKVFRVVGVKFIYDGATMQELTLQENNYAKL
jgi:hypothetical protein